MQRLQIGDCTIDVDEETAQEIINVADPNVAAAYLQELRRQGIVVNASDDQPLQEQSTSYSTLWRSSKKPTEMDNLATLALLNLRLKYSRQFADKKHRNQELWLRICTEMNDQGYFVGKGPEGRDRCKAKYNNIYSAYVTYLDKRKATGNGYVKPPPYLEQIQNIVGSKDKVNPKIIIESVPISIIDSKVGPSGTTPTPSPSSCASSLATMTVNRLNNLAGPSSTTPTPTSSSCVSPQATIVNRFNNIKKNVREKKGTKDILKDLVELQKESEERRKDEFKAMMNLLQQQNEQRHIQLMALLQNQKKRKHESDSD